MKVIKSKERETWQTKTAKGYEYPFGTTNIDCAVVEISGRHPLTGWYRNTQVDEMIYCKKGNGKIVFKDNTFELEEDDAVFIEKNKLRKIVKSLTSVGPFLGKNPAIRQRKTRPAGFLEERCE